MRDRFAILLGKDARFFDCLVGYFFISGFYRLYLALENVEKIRILVGLQTDRTAYDLLQRSKEQGELAVQSHASSKEQVAKDVLSELEKSADRMEIETGVHKFIEWIRSGKLEIRAQPTVMSRNKQWTLLSCQPLGSRTFRSISAYSGPFAPDFAPGPDHAAVTRILPARLDRGLRITISTSRPNAFKKLIRRSTENPLSR